MGKVLNCCACRSNDKITEAYKRKQEKKKKEKRDAMEALEKKYGKEILTMFRK